MEFNSVITELTTAATDVALAAVSLGCVGVLNRYRSEQPWRVSIWSWVFGLLAFASVLGALAHGLDLPPAAKTWLWRPLYLSLGLVVAMFVVGAVLDFKGAQASRRLLIPMVGVASAFFAVTQIFSGAFLIFVAYEGVAMVVALGMYLALVLRHSLEGAGTITAGIALNIVAAAIQATGAASFTVMGVPFDHNGVFHLVQIVALVVLVVGLAQSMSKR